MQAVGQRLAQIIGIPPGMLEKILHESFSIRSLRSAGKHLEVLPDQCSDG